MKLPENALGISDAKQFQDCPKLFHRNMLRHIRAEGAPDDSLITQNSEILSYGSCVHDAALLVVQDPDIYIDDAVDAAWAKWSPYLQPRHHAELREDVGVIIERTKETEENLELVCAEEDWKVPVFVGREDGALDEVKGEWYYYRFRIDALYRRKDDPTHYVIRDFKTTRRQRFQSDIDDDIQFTAYDYGVREALGEGVSQVTIWYDQIKHGEIFSSRDECDRIRFQEYIESTIKAVLDMPVERVIDTFKLNEWCGWCPLLETCQVVDYANDLVKFELSQMSGNDFATIKDVEPYVERYKLSKQAVKTLEEYNSRIGEFLKNNPGDYAGVSYSTSVVQMPKWKLSDLYEILGEKAIDLAGTISKSAIKDYLNNEAYMEALMAVRVQGGFERLNAKPIKKDE